MTSLKWRRYIERHVTLFGTTKTLQLVQTVIQGKLAFYDDLYQFCDVICMFSRFVSNISVYRIYGRRYDTYKTDFYPKMSEISNIACRCVKTMPEILKSRGIHDYGNFVFGVSNILFICKKQTKCHELNLTAIIQLDKFIFCPETCMVNGTWVRKHIAFWL